MRLELSACAVEMQRARDEVASLRALATPPPPAAAPEHAPPPAHPPPPSAPPTAPRGGVAPSPMVGLDQASAYGFSLAGGGSAAGERFGERYGDAASTAGGLPASMLTAADLARLSDIEEAQRAAEAAQVRLQGAMSQWSASHARTIEMLWSQALTGRWVGLVGGGGGAGGLGGTGPGGYGTSGNLVVGDGAIAGSGILVCWHEQAANSHESCFGWEPHAHEVRCAEAGVYEVAVGLWPATAGLLAELRVNGATALLIGEQPPAAAMAHPRGDAAGLCAVSLLSVQAGGVISVAAEHATVRTKVYLGLRKL